RLERLQRHRLGLVHAEHDALARARQLEQTLHQLFFQAVRADQLARDAELGGEREHQPARLKAWIRNVGARPARTEGRQELAAKERLAGADLPRDLDEALAVRHRDEQRVEGLLDALVAEEE